jgi:hypothetical protein
MIRRSWGSGRVEARRGLDTAQLWRHAQEEVSGGRGHHRTSRGRNDRRKRMAANPWRINDGVRFRRKGPNHEWEDADPWHGEGVLHGLQN